MEAGDAAISLFRALTMASRHATSSVEHVLMDHAGVSLPEYEILAALAASEAGQLRAGELGVMLAWEKSRTSHQVTRMERKGLVTRESCQADLRGTWVRICDQGREALETARVAYGDAVRDILGDLPERAEGTAFARVALEIGATAAPRECAGAVQGVADELGL